MVLEEVCRSFESWRSSKRGSRDLIPEALWFQASLLQAAYSRSTICKALRISYSQFNKHCGPASGQSHAVLESSFAEASLPSPLPVMCELSLQGARRTLRLTIPDMELSRILAILEAYL